MGLSEAKRYEQMAKAQRALPDALVIGLVKGRGGVNPGIATVGVLAANVVLCGGLLSLTGGFFSLGVLGILMAVEAISPSRTLVVTDRGIAMARPSMWSSRPPKIVSTVGHGYLQPAGRVLRWTKVVVGQEHLWLSWREEEALRAALFPQVVPYPQPQVSIPYR